MKLQTIGLLSIGLLCAANAFAQAQPKPEQQIEYRKSAMTISARSMGVLGAMAKGDIPFNKDVAVRHANLIAGLSDLPLSLGAFGPGTDKGAPTKADPKIWSSPEKFKAAYDKYVLAVKDLPAEAVDQKSLQAALPAIGRTCKSCHDDFRVTN